MLISDEVPLDESRRDELIEAFQVSHHEPDEHTDDEPLDEVQEDEYEDHGRD